MPDPKTKEPAGGEIEKKIEATPPSSVKDGIQQFIEKQSAKGDVPKEDPPVDKEKQLSKEGDKGDKTPAHKSVYFVDEEGNKIPFTMTVDGKLIEVTDPEKLRKYGQLGYHSDTRGKDLNERELKIKESEEKLQQEIGAFSKGQEMLGTIQKALEDGRLTMSDPASKIKEEAPEIDEELFSDPGMVALKKENLEIKESVKGLVGQLETTNKILLGKLVEEQHGKINDDIATLKPTYGLADEGRVWDLLALQDKEGKPLHDVEAAMKISQDEEKGKFDQYIKTDPDFANLSEDKKELAVKEYLEKKAAREKASISSPSGSPAGGVKGPKNAEDRKNWRMADYARAGADMVNKRIAAAKQS